MKEWNILVDYIDFYIYDKDSETVIISDSPEAGKAKEVYESFLEKYNIKNELTEDQIETFRKMTLRLLSENEKYNLTAITDEKEIFYKHFLDSSLGADLFKTAVFCCGTVFLLEFFL